MKIRVAVLACAAALLAATGAEAQAPAGSYQQSCSNATVAGSLLKARCRTMAGAMVDASLKLPCMGAIDNINGKLVCKPGVPRPPAPGTALPAGSYQETCSGEKVVGNTLTASCRTRAGVVVATAIALPCKGPIENIDGKLTCKALTGIPGPPVK